MQFKQTSLFDEPESTLKVYRGNRIEALLEIMASLLKKPLSSPFQEEVVIVQSKGMEQWVSLKLAERLGVAANISFLHPNTVLWKCCQQLFPSLGRKEPMDNDYLTWRLMELLPRMAGTKGFGEVAHYLEGNDPLKRHQLCRRLADLMNRYTVFRPEMVLGWEAGEENHWQAALWREVMKREERIHYADLRKMFLKEGKNLTKLPPGFPERINLFGVSSLPPFHVEFFKVMSLLTDVNFYLLNPCREFWFDISSKHAMAKVATKKGNAPEIEEELHLEEGNPLLASLGKSGKDLFSICEELELESEDCYIETGEEIMLSTMQSDILNLRERGKEDCPTKVVTADDRSLQIHSCHSPMREVEVLYDNLLALIEKNPAITPKDVLVMAPDIETYTPYIKAIFDRAEKPEMRIPYSITDRTIKDEKSAVNLFLKLLEIPGSRFEAGKLLDILAFPLVGKAFGISESGLLQVESWVRETRICWGLDEQHRASFNVPGFRENTWKAGLDRLLLGYAMPEEGEFFEGILPFGNIEGKEAQLLGNFLDFFQALVDFASQLEKPGTLKRWSETLGNALDIFFAPTQEEERDVLLIRNNLQQLARFQEVSGFSEAVGIELVKSHLSQVLGDARSEAGFITGRVTFCAMLPMRSIPYRVVYLLGMNEGAFPRNVRPLGFDLMAKHPKTGDRSPATDDRYLFLEALLSAREHFFISYVGRNIKDNSEKQPSLLVSELLEYAKGGFVAEDGSPASERMVRRHPLQAFDASYFQKKSDFFSYSEENLAAAVANAARNKSGRIFIDNPLPEPGEEWREIDVKDLCAFFQNPAKFFLTKRLGVVFHEMEDELEEKESFTLSGLDRYQLSQEVLEGLEKGGDVAHLEQIFLAEGRLPHGEPGRNAFSELLEETRSFWERISGLGKGTAFPAITLDLKLGEFCLRGKLEDCYEKGLFLCRPAKVKPTDRLRGWIYALLLRCAAPESYPSSTCVVGKDAAFAYSAPLEASELLQKLLSLYWQGLSRPLHFFPDVSLAYVEETRKGKKSDEECLWKCRGLYEGSEFSVGTGTNPYYQKAFEGTDPVASRDFPETALAVFVPLLDHETKP